MVPAALFLAAKVEEQPRKLEHVIKVAHACLHPQEPLLDTKSEVSVGLEPWHVLWVLEEWEWHLHPPEVLRGSFSIQPLLPQRDLGFPCSVQSFFLLCCTPACAVCLCPWSGSQELFVPRPVLVGYKHCWSLISPHSPFYMELSSESLFFQGKLQKI